jgi:archaellum component FlaC
MVENTNPSSSQFPSSDSTDESVGDRLEKLREKVSDLSETLKRVEQTAAEAGNHLKE